MALFVIDSGNFTLDSLFESNGIKGAKSIDEVFALGVRKGPVIENALEGSFRFVESTNGFRADKTFLD